MDKIKEAVEEFKKDNGNNSYPVKDLVIYAIKRLDNLPCEKHTGTIATAKEKIFAIDDKLDSLIRRWRWVAALFFSGIIAMIGIIAAL